EEQVIKNPEESVMIEIQALKKQLIKFRKVVVPLRDVLSSIQKDETKIVDNFTLNYFRDVHDHIIQVIETIELQKESLSSLTDLYLSGISNKMNKIMQMLTIIATIFIPLTFIVGVYGMNFDNLPELHFKYGYFYIWGLMIGIILMMIRYFKRKKWL
ncbi:MAG: magnesium and cobalt transport protein CorA, partial [Zetaproteobacteria bacterium]|nr:magnesium and cobalt transport protein CorA [Flavobacteriales bacterium]